MTQKSAYQVWCTGEIDSNILEFWKELKSLNLELSSLIPFFRISHITYKPKSDGDIKEILPFKKFNFIKSQLKSENLKGYYGIESFDLEVTGTANSLYKGSMTIKIYDLDLIENKKDNIHKLLNLGENVMIDFGWSKWDWGEIKPGNIDDLIYHGGRGHTIFAKVSGRDISFDEENVMEIQLNFTSSTYNLMNNKQLQNLVEIEWDEVENIIEIHTAKQGSFQWFRNFLGKLFGKNAIKLKHLFDYLITKIKNTNQIDMITGVIDTNIPVDKDEIKDSIDPNIILDGGTVGDFIVTIKLIDEIYDKSKTFRKFINNILKKINKAYNGDLNLELIKTPKGSESLVEDKAQDADYLWKNRKKYLKLDFGNKNSLVQTISFSSDLSEGMKTQEVYSNTSQIKGATPTMLKSFVTTWIYGEEKWESLDEDVKNHIVEKLSEKEPDKLLKTLLEESSLYPSQNVEEQKEFISTLKNVVKNRQIRDNSIRYMPYKMSATLFGISDIWTGSNIYLDENFINPIHKNTVWKVTDVKHSISDNNWTISIDAQLIYRKKWHEFAAKINKYVQEKISSNTGIETTTWQYYQ